MAAGRSTESSRILGHGDKLFAISYDLSPNHLLKFRYWMLTYILAKLLSNGVASTPLQLFGHLYVQFICATLVLSQEQIHVTTRRNLREP